MILILKVYIKKNTASFDIQCEVLPIYQSKLKNEFHAEPQQYKL